MKVRLVIGFRPFLPLVQIVKYIKKDRTFGCRLNDGWEENVLDCLFVTDRQSRK